MQFEGGPRGDFAAVGVEMESRGDLTAPTELEKLAELAEKIRAECETLDEMRRHADAKVSQIMDQAMNELMNSIIAISVAIREATGATQRPDP
jgi:hypothetical protein